MKDLGLMIADRVRNLRESHQLTLEQMAEQTGVSKSMLFQMERGGSNPSIQTLYKISNAFQVSLSYLIREEGVETKVVKTSDLSPICNPEDTYRIFNFFPMETGRKFEIFYGEVEVGGILLSEAHQKGTEEYLSVFQGELLISIGEAEFRLEKGNAIAFKADVPHSYYNYGVEKVYFSNTIFYAERR